MRGRLGRVYLIGLFANLVHFGVVIRPLRLNLALKGHSHLRDLSNVFTANTIDLLLQTLDLAVLLLLDGLEMSQEGRMNHLISNNRFTLYSPMPSSSRLVWAKNCSFFIS